MEIAILVFFLAFGVAALVLFLLIRMIWRRAARSSTRREFSGARGTAADSIHQSAADDYDEYAAATYLATEDYQNQRVEEMAGVGLEAAGTVNFEPATGEPAVTPAWSSDSGPSYESSSSYDSGTSYDSGSSSSSDSSSSSSDSGSSSSSSSD